MKRFDEETRQWLLEKVFPNWVSQQENLILWQFDCKLFHARHKYLSGKSK